MRMQQFVEKPNRDSFSSPISPHTDTQTSRLIDADRYRNAISQTIRQNKEIANTNLITAQAKDILATARLRESSIPDRALENQRYRERVLREENQRQDEMNFRRTDKANQFDLALRNLASEDAFRRGQIKAQKARVAADQSIASGNQNVERARIAADIEIQSKALQRQREEGLLGLVARTTGSNLINFGELRGV